VSHHLFNLVVRAWNTMITATGTTTLGFVVWTLSLTAVGWASALTAKWFELRGQRIANPFRQALGGSVLTGLFLAGGIVGLLFIALFAFIVRTVYQDHESLVHDRDSFAERNERLSAELERKRHFLDTTDPAFGNIVFVLRAFQQYRNAMQGRPCVIWFSAPLDTLPMAFAIAQFSSTVSGCMTFGPTPPGNPDLDEEATDGMIPGVVLLHADRDNQGANELALTLQAELNFRRSYKLLSKKFVHYQNQGKMNETVMWLQFGTGTKWNTQLR